MEPFFNLEAIATVAEAVIDAANQARHQIERVCGEVPGVNVRELTGDFYPLLGMLEEWAGQARYCGPGGRHPKLPPSLSVSLVPLFKALLFRARLARARELERQREATAHPGIIAALERKLEPFDGVIRSDWFRAAAPYRVPVPAEFLTLERAEALSADPPLAPRQYDEKFHLLQAPALFLPDLAHFRAKCALRGAPVAVAFLDLDKFKDFNTEVGETHVDRHVLPDFMRAVEAAVFGHGFAYRYGGDEYALLMPNAGPDLAAALLGRVRDRTAALRFHGTERTLGFSAGLCVAGPDCSLTDREVLQRAERAKNFAKRQGRGRTGAYTGPLFDEGELALLD